MIDFIFWIVAVLLLVASNAQNIEPVAKEVGSTLCTYLAYKNVLHRKWFNQCGKPTCSWNDWSEASDQSKKKKNAKERYVISYAHNGFGNQLWEHSIAFMAAESLNARLLIAIIPDSLSPGGVLPPNTWSGMGAMERLLPKEFLYETLPENSTIRTVCDNEKFYISDRPKDWRDENYSKYFRGHFLNLIEDPKPRCLKMVGYFQNLPMCSDDVKRLWTPKLFANFTQSPGENDISIYLRCLPRHYYFNDKYFYEVILNNTDFDNVWLFQAPECPNPAKLDPDPSRDGQVASVVRLLVEKYGAKKWPGYQGTDDASFLLHDLAGLARSKKMILPVSSWAFWSGIFSNATEIHVNSYPYHQIMYNDPQYIYHDEKNKQYFGKWNQSANDIEFAIDAKTMDTTGRLRKNSNDVNKKTSSEDSSSSATSVVVPTVPPKAPVVVIEQVPIINGEKVSDSSTPAASTSIAAAKTASNAAASPVVATDNTTSADSSTDVAANKEKHISKDHHNNDHGKDSNHKDHHKDKDKDKRHHDHKEKGKHSSSDASKSEIDVLIDMILDSATD